MNYLAHAFLSFDEPKILVGNLIGDFVRGELSRKFEKGIVDGIKLHREIDVFTDSHLAVKKAQKILKPDFGLYSLVITDIYFDFFLTKSWSQYDHRPLEAFSQYVYEVLNAHDNVLPRNFLPIFKAMKGQNWLVRYGTLDGMKAALTGISKRATFNSKMEIAHLVLEEKQDEFKACFDEFFPELLAYSRQRLTKIQAGT